MCNKIAMVGEGVLLTLKYYLTNVNQEDLLKKILTPSGASAPDLDRAILTEGWEGVTPLAAAAELDEAPTFFKLLDTGLASEATLTAVARGRALRSSDERIRLWAKRAISFLRRSERDAGPPVHRSAPCEVYLAPDRARAAA